MSTFQASLEPKDPWHEKTVDARALPVPPLLRWCRKGDSGKGYSINKIGYIVNVDCVKQEHKTQKSHSDIILWRPAVIDTEAMDRQQKRDLAIKALVDAVKELIEVAGAANRSSFDQIKDALDGCQGIAEDALAAMEATE